MSDAVISNKKDAAPALRGKRWIRWMFIAVVPVVLLPFCLFMFVRLYKPEIIVAVNREISGRYNADIHFDDVDISLFKTFPRTSLVLKNLSVKNPLVADSLLLKAERIYLTVDIISLFRREVVFDGLRMDGTEMCLTKYKNGKSNWEILTSDTTSSNVIIEDIVLNNCNLKYNNQSARWVSHFDIHRAKINGDFMASHSILNVDIRFEVDSLMSMGNSYQTDVPFKIKAENVIRRGNKITCADVDCSSGDVLWNVDLALDLETQNPSHVFLETSDTPLQDLIQMLPQKYIRDLGDYSLDGESDLKLELFIGANQQSLNGGFQLRDGTCIFKNGAEVNEIFTDIKFGNENGGFCEIIKCSAATENGKMDLGGRLDFAKLGNFQGTLQYDGPLEEWAVMFAMGEEYKIAGGASIQAKLQGVLFDMDAKLSPEIQEGSGGIRIHDASAFIPALNASAQDIHLEAVVNADEVKITSLNFMLNGSHFQVTGSIVNLPGAMVKNGTLQMTDVVILSDQLNIQDWNLQKEDQEREEITKSESTSMVHVLQGQFKCNNLIREGLNLKDFACAFNCSLNEVRLDKIRAGIANGRIEGLYIQRSNDLEGHFSFENIDMQQLFQQTKNFGQNKITSQNLSGQLTGTTKVNAALGNDGSIDTKTLWMESDVTIRNGRLRNYTPLIQLVDFIEANRMLSVFTNEDELRTKLSDVEFRDLKNTLYVQDGQIIIPEMKIKSSAFDITAEGKQSFDGMIDYNIGFNIFEVLRKREAESGKARNNIFIHMFGTTDKPQFEVEREWIKLPEIKLPSFLSERSQMEDNTNSNESVTESGEADTTDGKRIKLPSLIKNKDGETRKWLKERE